MNSKKAITLLVLATLLMTLIPITGVHSISDIVTVHEEVDGEPGLELYEGVYGDTLIVIGSGVTAGKTVNVYWDSVDPWNGESGLLNGTKAGASGTFELWFEIPEATAGAHYLWLQDMNTGDVPAAPTMITVLPKIDVKPSSALPGDEVTIYGYGYDSEEDVTSITSDLPSITTSPNTPETDELGSWTATFDVDDTAAYSLPGVPYTITATQGANTAEDTLVVGAALTSNIEVGNVGAVVRLSGRGFADSGSIVSIIITDGVTDFECVLVDEDDDGITSRGTFTTDIVIPMVDAVSDDWEIIVEDNLGNTGSVDFEVTGLPEVETDPEYGVQGSTVAVMGYNFTKIAGEDVTLWLLDSEDMMADEVEIKDIETKSDGTFSGTMKVPAVASGVYYLLATQDDWNIDNMLDLYTDDALPPTFKVGLSIIILSPDSGPTGEYVSMTASGLTEDGDYQFNISDTVILEGSVEPDGSISEMFTVPLFEPGVYTASLLDIESDITLTTEFEVTNTAMVETSPLVAPNGYNVTIMGWYFSQAPGEEDLEFLLFNDTDEWDLDVRYGGVGVALGIGTDEDDWDDGYFSGWFVSDWGVNPALDIGTYVLNVTDGAGIVAQYDFNVVSKIEEIDPRKTAFKIGETVSFNVVSTFGQYESYIEIYTPDGELYWTTEPFWEDAWIDVGTEQVYPGFSQIAAGNLMTLLDDAPLGDWSWVWYDSDDDELDSGTFTVEASSADVLGEQVADLNNKLTDLSSQVDAVSSEFDSVKSDIADVAAIAEQAVAAAQQAADAVETVAQTANQANTAAENAATAAEAARDAANGLTTLVYGAIGAALVAALAAIVSLMQINSKVLS